MNILDALIVVFIILGAMAGFRRGFVKQTVLLIGLVITLIFSFYLKNPVAAVLYKNLPFFKFNGVFKGVSVLNILIYELIAFLLVFSVLYLALRIILKITGLIESLLKATIILGFVSKILGAIVGMIESYIIIFIILIISTQPFIHLSGIDDSLLATKMLEYTPLMSSATKNTRKVIKEVSELSNTYKKDSKEFNKKSIELFVKYNIISQENIDYLREKGKIE